MIKLVTIWMATMMLLTILAFSCMMVKKKESSSSSKWTKFECGFNLMTPSHIPFSFQFFLIALLFLIFDVEISMLLSFPLENNTIMKSITLLVFLIVLAIGLLYEWKKGKIDWSEWGSLYSCTV